MSSLDARPIAAPCMFPQVKIKSQHGIKFGHIESRHTPSVTQSLYFGRRRSTICAIQLRSSPITCAAGLNARCAVEQTKTTTRLGAQSLSFGGRQGTIHPSQTQFASLLCAATLSARCGAGQTQTITREAPTISPLRVKEKMPGLDDGSFGLPRDLGGGNSGLPPGGDGGGGGGGGGAWWGGFYFFAFLVFLSFLKDEEGEDPSNSEYDS